MGDEKVRQLVEQAVAQRFDEWARRHPNLAAVIDGIELRQQAVESLRASPAYQQAVADYHAAMSEQALMGQLLDLAKTAVAAMVG